MQALIGKAMEPVIQEEPTGCGIAASAALAGVSYAEAKKKANALGIYSADKSLWSETEHVRTLIREFGISVSPKETPFKTWESLPDKALLAIKWRTEHGKSRSEEHTSELQSRPHLVCRLLLEKKK